MERYLAAPLKADLARKMVFVTGPRQVGKTHLAKSLMPAFVRPLYLNYDVLGDSRIIATQTWPLTSDLLVFDEVHKMKQWKSFLKRVFDGREPGQSILVTGSAKMETFRQGDESLAGRFFHYHLLPLTVRELVGQVRPQEALDGLTRLGGFPEPFLSGSETEAAPWRNQYYADLVREDIVEVGRIGELRAMRSLLALLRGRVGSVLSYNALSRDLQLSQPTVKRYIEILEALYIVFLVRPHHRNVARSILKEPKLYFYDTGLVEGDEGIRMENTVAVSLLKHASYLRDTAGREVSLHYLRTKDGKEVDFTLVEGGIPRELIEVKLSSPEPSPALAFFRETFFPGAAALQLVANLAKPRRGGASGAKAGILVQPAAEYLAGLEA
jgi:hypothetical protein